MRKLTQGGVNRSRLAAFAKNANASSRPTGTIVSNRNVVTPLAGRLPAFNRLSTQFDRDSGCMTIEQVAEISEAGDLACAIAERFTTRRRVGPTDKNIHVARETLQRRKVTRRDVEG